MRPKERPARMYGGAFLFGGAGAQIAGDVTHCDSASRGRGAGAKLHTPRPNREGRPASSSREARVSAALAVVRTELTELSSGRLRTNRPANRLRVARRGRGPIIREADERRYCEMYPTGRRDAPTAGSFWACPKFDWRISKPV